MSDVERMPGSPRSGSGRRAERSEQSSTVSDVERMPGSPRSGSGHLTSIDRRAKLAAQLDELLVLATPGGPGPPPASGSATPVSAVAAAGRRTRVVGAVRELQRRLREDRIRVLVVGESKRGKSTLANALIGQPVLPMGVTPLTAVPTTVTYGGPPGVRVCTAGGQYRDEPLTALADLVSEEGNPSNRLGLASVVVRLPAPLLAEGLELVDTPGTGSVHEANTAEAQLAYEAMDAAIFVVTADPPISAAERELLRSVLPSSVATFVALNKADRLSPSELSTALEFTRNVVKQAAGRDLPVYVCSARQALGLDPVPVIPTDDAGHPLVNGISTLATDLTAYLRTHKASALLTSLRHRAGVLIAQLRDEVVVTVRAADLQRSADGERVALFRAHLDSLQRRQQDAGDLVRGESRRLLSDLNADAERTEEQVVAQVVSALRAWLVDAGDIGNAEVETRGHQLGSALIEREVESWRSGRARILQARLADLDERLRAGLDADLAGLRPAARELLGLDLTAAPTEVALAPSFRFYYQFSIDLDPVGMLAAGVRHRLPGRAGRSRTARHLLEQMSLLARQQVGRARADLQERLTQTTRTMLSALGERYADHSGRMLDALDAADQLATASVEPTNRAPSAAESAAARASLAERERRLTDLLDRIGAADDPELLGAASAVSVGSGG